MDVHKLVTAHLSSNSKERGGIVVEKQKKGLFVGRSLNCNSGSSQKYRSLLTVLYRVHKSPTLGDSVTSFFVSLLVIRGASGACVRVCACASLGRTEVFGLGESLFPDTI